MTQNNDIYNIVKVGLTGGIGSGKSTVAGIFFKKGIDIIDADQISHEVIEIYPEIKNIIKCCFGKDFFDDNNNLLRRKLGDCIFKDKDKKEKLESIIIPYIKDEILKRMNDCKKNGKSICIVDAPTLIESGLYKHMDYNILVWTDEKTQIERVKERDGMTSEQVSNRIKSQMPLESKKHYADYIINNNGNISDAASAAENVIKDILCKNKKMGGKY